MMWLITFKFSNLFHILNTHTAITCDLVVVEADLCLPKERAM